MKYFLIAMLFALTIPAIAQEQNQRTVENGEDLIRLIFETHSPNWYKHLTFKQNIFNYRNDTLVRNEEWVVAYSAPSKLHIRYVDFDSGRGWLVVNDSIYSYNHGKLIGKKFRLHEQTILGFDIYTVEPSLVIPKVKGLSIDLSMLTTTTVSGKLVYQVGNPDKHCFWIGKDDLLLHGIRKTTDNNVSDTFFQNYKIFYGKPVATEMQYFRNGKMYRFEKYYEIRLPSSFPDIFFDPSQFDNTRW